MKYWRENISDSSDAKKRKDSTFGMYALKTRQYERPSSILADSKINLEMPPSL